MNEGYHFNVHILMKDGNKHTVPIQRTISSTPENMAQIFMNELLSSSAFIRIGSRLFNKSQITTLFVVNA